VPSGVKPRSGLKTIATFRGRTVQSTTVSEELLRQGQPGGGFRKYLPIPAALGLLGLIAAGGVSFIQPEQSIAKAPVVIGADPDIAVSSGLAPSERLREADRFLRSEVVAIRSKELLERAAAAVGETGKYRSSALQRSGTDIVDLSVIGPKPEAAGKIMKSLVDLYSEERVDQFNRRTAVSIARIDARIRQLRELADASVAGAGDWEAFTSELTALSGTRASLGLRSVQKQDLVRIVDRTNITGRVAPRLRPNLLLLGALSGLLAGLAIAFARARLRSSASSKSESSGQLAGFPVLGTFHRGARGAVNPSGSVAPEARTLSNLLAALNVKRIMIAGVSTGHAASFVADQLANATAAQRQTVLLDVTGATARPARTRDFNLGELTDETDRGLTTLGSLLRAASDRHQPLVMANGDRLDEGSLPRQAIAFLERIERDNGLVLLDSEPLKSIGASLRWARHGDVIVVTDPSQTPRAELDTALATLRMVGARVLGIVVVHDSTVTPTVTLGKSADTDPVTAFREVKI
jgi:hypothetical protein